MIELPRLFLGLNPQELRFVEALINAPARIVSHRDMQAAISNHEDSDSRISQVIACKARKKLAETFGGAPVIETVWGRGYRLADGARDLILQAAGFDVREAA